MNNLLYLYPEVLNQLKHILFFLFLFIAGNIFATHNRSGEITYQWLGGNQYKIRVTTYTNYTSPSLGADRCVQTVYISTLSGFVLDSIECPRVNGTLNCQNNGPATAKDGEILDPGTDRYKKNVYECVYAFNSGATYIIYMFDPNRNGGIINISGQSDQQPFALADTLKTFNMPGLSVNSTPVLLNPPIDEACVGKPFIHNPNAFDSDGDSLSYNHSIIFGEFAQPVPGYIPATAYGITIDPVTGDFYWPSPQQQGEYNFGILITEWRKTSDGDYVRVGSVLRDLQINVVTCTNNPPQIANIPDVCILAGTNFNQVITASDQDNNAIELSVTGGPFSISSAATFTYTSVSGNSSGTMNWTPSCSSVRKQPYLITIKAKDIPFGTQPRLSDFESFFIRVVAPPPQNVSANPLGTSIVLNWNAPLICNQTTGNIIVSYWVYRKDVCSTITVDPCGDFDPEAIGYSKIGTINAIAQPSNFSFTDNNNGNGLSQGIDYSYIIIALFADGSTSVASSTVCAKLVRNVPIITNVSVDTTAIDMGKIHVRWTKPILKTVNNNGFDTILNPGPYRFDLIQNITGQTNESVIYSVPHLYFSEFSFLQDTSKIIENLNTDELGYSYKINFYSNGNFMGSSQKASSVRLQAIGMAKRVQLNWTSSTPWINTWYFIYREQSVNNFILIDSTQTKSYIDTGLVNGQSYCYKIKSKGAYSDPTILSPLINWSQIKCAITVDREAPCQPTIVAAFGNCETQTTQLNWANSDVACSYDIQYYNLYFTPFIDSQFVKIATYPATVNSFVSDYSSSIAGCYAVTAVDSFGNESALLQKMCVDNCPEYELPNIITVNGDQVNDVWIPIKNKFVKEVDLHIYNRWGNLIYETTDAAIGWDGKVQQTNKICANGTYYYICEVKMIRYTGIETIKLKGFIEVISNQ